MLPLGPLRLVLPQGAQISLNPCSHKRCSAERPGWVGPPLANKESPFSEPPTISPEIYHPQEKAIPKKKKWKKAKWFSEEALQIAEKRREAKGKGEKERYIHLNAEFQRIARRDKKAFLSDQCKETEEKNRMGKTRDLFKKMRDTKGTFHAKMGSVKGKNGMDLTEKKDIKKRWQECTEEL